MATLKIVLHTANLRKDGTYPVSLRVIKYMKIKYCSTGLYAHINEWDESAERFINNKKVCPMNKEYNARLIELVARAQAIILQFDRDGIDWTLNQFEEEFTHKTKKGKFLDYANKIIKDLKETGHNGTGKVYEAAIYNLSLFDPKLKSRLLQEIDIKYVHAYNSFMEKRGWVGNTRLHEMKTLRAILNRAILEKECTANFYPFGKGGFPISSLAEETRKRYLSEESLKKLIGTKSNNKKNEEARLLFIFSYLCFGMSYVDMANLKKDNIITENGKEYIIYKRHKTEHNKNAKFIKIPLGKDLKEILEWFSNNGKLLGDHILPLMTIDCTGDKLYDHLQRRRAKYNNYLRRLATEFELPEKITRYVSRHSMAMTLQDDGTPREIISQIMGHKDLKTTNVYLDSFGNEKIEEVTNKSLYKNRIAL